MQGHKLCGYVRGTHSRTKQNCCTSFAQSYFPQNTKMVFMVDFSKRYDASQLNLQRIPVTIRKLQGVS
jgi:hypothetical protein